MYSDSFSHHNQVNDWLIVGADLDIAKALGNSYDETLNHLMGYMGVNWVIDARSEWEDSRLWVEAGLPTENYAHLPIIDSWNHKPSERWFEGIEDFVQRFLDEAGPDESMYVHCHMGINRGPSAAMLALLVESPDMSPWDAFMKIREARSVAGLVYAENVGAWHILKTNPLPLGETTEFFRKMRDYWTPQRTSEVNRGISYYRSVEGRTTFA